MTTGKGLDFKNWATAPPSWITSSGTTLDGTVLASRVRIARNLTSFPYPHNSPISTQKQILQTVIPVLVNTSILKKSISLQLAPLTLLDRTFLMERQLISHQHAYTDGAKGLVVSSGESLSVMINEEDHIRAASFYPGFGITEAWENLSKLDDEMNQHLPISYHQEFGFLTAWPTNTGTGLRASCLLHLPGLILTRQISPAIQNLDEMGLTIRGFYGEGTSAVGDLLQVSNAKTLGITELDLIKKVEKVVKNLHRLENLAMDELLSSQKRGQLEDQIYRSLGTLKSARLLNYNEAMQHLSMVRLGIKLGLKLDIEASKITNLFFLSQSAHVWIGRNQEGDIKTSKEVSFRADFMRSFFDKNSHH
ncbi:hypothetical protein BVX98_06570 [bacterium F11]|nr:hypothetical protein BVX98_06570 [bacterium F11]